jgi:hypothetical protein
MEELLGMIILCSPCRIYIGSTQAASCRHELVVGQSPAGKDVSTEAEEYPLLGAVTMQWLVSA